MKLTAYENGVLDGYLINAPVEIQNLIIRLRLHGGSQQANNLTYDMNMSFKEFATVSGLSPRAANAILYDNKYCELHPDRVGKYNLPKNTLGELLKCHEHHLSRIPNFGRKSLNDLKAALAKMGLCLTGQYNV